MFTIRPMSGGESYSANYLEQSDYYSEDRKITGQWLGKAAERLGLGGAVDPKDFEAVRECLHPTTGEKLRPRASANRLDKEGNLQSKGRDLYDMTFSAPKSASIMACIGGDKRILEIHTRAMREALEEAERCAQTRVRVAGQSTDRWTRNFVTASYLHDASRDLDPQIHTHNATLNLTYDHVEERFKALQMGAIFERQSYITEIYRNVLARGLEEIGYETEYRLNSKMTDRNVEIKAISPEFCKNQSRMSERRDEAIRIFAAEFGRKPTHNEETILIRRVRPDKDTSLTPEDVHDIQMSRCSPEELAMVSEAWRNTTNYVRPQQGPGVEESVRYALNHIFERVSVAQDFEVLEEALRHNRGRASLDQIKAHLRDLEKSGTVLTHDGEIATEESLSREKAMIGMVDNGRGMYEPLHRYRDFTISDRLTDPQRDAVDYVLNSCGLAVNLRGAPGTGKTFTLQEIKRGLEQAERTIVAVAPTKSAEEELRRVGFAQSMTVEGLLQDKDASSRLFNSVVIIDEAGMIGSEQMFQLLSLASRCGSRVIFSGDTHQIQPVVAGDALRVLEKHSTLGSVELTEPQRQKNQQYSDAVKTLRDSPDQGFDMLESQGAVKEFSDLERPRAVAKARRELLERDPDGTTIVVAPTHTEIASVTEAIRADRREHGELGEDHKLTRLEPLNWTTAEKSDMRNYSPGQMLVFHRPTKDAARHDIFEIISVRDNAVLARGQDGTETEFTAKQAKSFGVFAAREIEIAPGDRLMLQQNRRGPEFRATNGEFVEVKTIDAKGRIELEDGRILPENYRSFTHGYAATSHKAQGKTVRNVLISGNTMSRELFYVSASRGQESVQIFTANAEVLRDSIGVSGARQSATELAARALEAGLEYARNQAWWTDYATGAPTQDPSRAQPNPTQGQPSRVQQERHHDRANERGFSR